MLNPKIRDQAYQFFIEEAPELLEIIEHGVLNLKTNRTTNNVHELMRAAHSLKGGSASVGLESIKTISHHLEDIFKAFYNQEVLIDEDLDGLLLEAYDALKIPLMEQIETNHHDSEAALAKALPIIELIELLLGENLDHTDQYLPSSSDLGVDIVKSIFEVDVAQALEKLETLLKSSDQNQITDELRASAEMFSGFSELLNLPGFGEISQMATQALNCHPEQYLEITKIALEDWQRAIEAILAGDRNQGGSPSVALLALATEEVLTPTVPQADLNSLLENYWEPEEETSSEHEVLIPPLETPPTLEPLSLDEVFYKPLVEQSIDNALVLGSELTSLDEMFGSPTSPSLDEIFVAQDELSPLSLDELPQLDLSPVPTQEDSTSEIFSERSELSVSEYQELPQEKLEEVIESIQALFAQLPPVSEVENIPEETISTKVAAVENEQEIKTQQVSPTLSIRVAFERLEKMSNLVGELSINRNSLSLQNEQIQSTVKELLNRFSRFARMTGKLRDLSDKLILAPLKSPNRQVQPDSSLAEFDVLEMDRYSLLYGLLQDILEEMLQLEESVDDVVLFARTSNQTLEQQRQMLQGLRDELMWARMLPLGEVLGRFPRLLRDLSNKYHKPVQLQVTGHNVLVDRIALEKLYDPLVHLLRNAFDHGIEPSLQREQLGKSKEGKILIRAYHQGNQTIIEVQDDGKGLSLEKIGQQAVKAGLITPEELTTIPREDLSNLIFEPGFSTAEEVSELSGRGVGLDVVRDQVRLLKGTVTVSSSPDKGTTFSLRLPLTMTIAKLLVCLVHNSQSAKNIAVAIPSDTIEEIIIPNPLQIKTSTDNKFLYWQDNLIPIYPLQEYLNYNCLIPETFSSKAITPVPIPEEWCSPLLLIRQEQSIFALEVNRLLIEQELVVKPFGRAITSPSYSYGCTILGDGALIPVVNAALLIEQVLQSESGIPVVPTLPMLQPEVPAILVVDDSATMRRTLALTLQKSGYRVIQAKDGKEALDQLQGGAQVRMIICDVEMPNMNGFEFLGQRRQDPKLKTIPVIMLTSRGSQKHRKLADYLGANAYFTKPFIEQQFLKEINNILSPASSIEQVTSLTN